MAVAVKETAIKAMFQYLPARGARGVRTHNSGDPVAPTALHTLFPYHNPATQRIRRVRPLMCSKYEHKITSWPSDALWPGIKRASWKG